MKGLILKDIYMAVKYCRIYFLIAVVFAAIYVWNDMIVFAVYPTFLASAVSVNLLSYDEKSKWSSYAGTFPFTRAQMVSAKYIITLLTLGICILVTAAGYAGHMIVDNNFSISRLFGFLVLLLPVGLVSPAIMLPVIFRFGVEKGRIAYLTVLVVFGGALGALGAVGMDISTTDLLHGQSAGVLLSAALIGALIFTGSWLLSSRIYAKRDLS